MDIVTRQQAKEQGLTTYFTGKPCRHGHTSTRRVDSQVCTECQSIAREKWYTETRPQNIEHHNALAKVASQRQRVNNPTSCLLSAAKRRANQNGLDFNITHEDIEIPTHCPVFGIPLLLNSGRQNDNSPSLDRIDNSKGYIKGNVRVVSWRLNQRKSDMSIAEILALADYVKRELKLS